MQAKIVVIEDEKEICELISLFLSNEGIETHSCASGEEGLAAIAEGGVDLVILDINLPGIDGYEVLQALRREYSFPVIIVSARNDDADMILGFGCGADDFVQKPFSPKVLSARVRAHLRRSEIYGAKHRLIRFGNYQIDMNARIVKEEQDGGFRPVALSPRETELLIELARHRGKPLNQRELFETVWGKEYGDITTVAVHIQRLRKKLEKNPAKPTFIMTVKGFGYMLTTEELH